MAGQRERLALWLRPADTTGSVSALLSRGEKVDRPLLQSVFLAKDINKCHWK